MIYSILKTIDSVKSENYHFKKFFSALYSLLITAESTA